MRHRVDALFYVLLGFILLLVCVVRTNCQNRTQAYAVCEGRCLSGLKILPTTQLVAPMVNGKADYSKAVIYNIGVNVDHNLEKIEMR